MNARISGNSCGISRSEQAFFAAVLLLASGAVLPLYRKETAFVLDESAGDPVVLALWSGVYIVTIALAARSWRAFLEAAWRDLLLVCLVGAVFMSTAWSVSPSVTLRRGVAFMGTTAVGIYLGARLGLVELQRLVSRALTIAILGSAGAALLFPQWGVAAGTHAGAWQGIFVHKNVLGRLMVLATVTYLLTSPSTAGDRRKKIALLSCSIALVLLSTSKTALVSLLGLVFSIAVLWIVRRRWRLGIPLLLVTAMIIGVMVAWASANYASVLGALGRDDTFTGRTVLWVIVTEKITERPWLGYGYSAFWTSAGGFGGYVKSLVKWDANFSHNGFLDVALDLGLVGAALITASLLRTTGRAIVWMRQFKGWEAYWPAVTMLFMISYNFTESALLRQNNFFWILFVAIATARFRPPWHCALARVPTQVTRGLEQHGSPIPHP